MDKVSWCYGPATKHFFRMCGNIIFITRFYLLIILRYQQNFNHVNSTGLCICQWWEDSIQIIKVFIEVDTIGPVLSKKEIQRKIVIIFLSISLNMWDGSFEYPQHMFWLRNKKIIFLLSTLIWEPGILIGASNEYHPQQMSTTPIRNKIVKSAFMEPFRLRRGHYYVFIYTSWH